MKKSPFLIAFFLLGLVPGSFAAKGYDNDGYLFILAVVAVLVIIAGLLWMADFLRRRGKELVKKARPGIRMWSDRIKSRFADHKFRIATAGC